MYTHQYQRERAAKEQAQLEDLIRMRTPQDRKAALKAAVQHLKDTGIEQAIRNGLATSEEQK